MPHFGQDKEPASVIPRLIPETSRWPPRDGGRRSASNASGIRPSDLKSRIASESKIPFVAGALGRYPVGSRVTL